MTTRQNPHGYSHRQGTAEDQGGLKGDQMPFKMRKSLNVYPYLCGLTITCMFLTMEQLVQDEYKPFLRQK